MPSIHADYLIIGGGIMGLAVARALRAHSPKASIILLEKEAEVAQHASGRNSGVLHAGFYYSADSLKARFCRDGNAALRQFVQSRNLKINDCKKVVVAQNESELPTLHELYKRGQVNGVQLKLIDEKELADIEPNAKTTQQAIYSPTTAVVDPVEICQTLKNELETAGVLILRNTPYQKRLRGNAIRAGGKTFEAGTIINCAGLYADRIARQFGFCQHYASIPFKGVYLRYRGDEKPVKPCIYPVPNLRNPFLGVHFSVTVQGDAKIGPTAIPAFWRENYGGLTGFSLRDAAEILGWEALLFATNADFRGLAFTEMRKYSKSFMVSRAGRMVKHIGNANHWSWGRPGIRAQLIDMRTRKLLHDFVVEGDTNSVHVLNAVSPAFTSSFPFAEWIVEKFINIPSPSMGEG